MGLFGRKKPSKDAHNLINDRELKEKLANAALSFLSEGEDYHKLDNLTCEFGYLFDIDNHGLEALFKITTDKSVNYFAAQKKSVMRLQFNEELFRSTTETFLALHDK